MPGCNVDRFFLEIIIPDRLKDLVEFRSFNGEDAIALLNLLVSEGCDMQVLEFDHFPSDDCVVPSVRPSSKKSDALDFRNVFINTSDLANLIGQRPRNVISFIKEGSLSAAKQEGSSRWVVIKDEKCDVFVSKYGLNVTPQGAKKKSYYGRGLKRMIGDALTEGLIPSSFGVRDVVKGLLAKNWRPNIHYKRDSIRSAVEDLMNDGCVVVERDGVVTKRVWSYTPGQVSLAVNPSDLSVRGVANLEKSKVIDSIVDEIVEEVLESMIPSIRVKVKSRIKELIFS